LTKVNATEVLVQTLRIYIIAYEGSLKVKKIYRQYKRKKVLEVVKRESKVQSTMETIDHYYPAIA